MAQHGLQPALKFRCSLKCIRHSLSRIPPSSLAIQRPVSTQAVNVHLLSTGRRVAAIPTSVSRPQHRAMAHGDSKGHVLWGYDDQSAWGKVKGWEVASTGRRQSPIDIETHHVTTNAVLKPLQLNDWDSALSGKFSNTGHSIQFTPATPSPPPTITTTHGTYSLKQFHFHWGATSNIGSEHCIDGMPQSSEIHFVLRKTRGPKDSGDALMVLGVLCDADHSYNIRGTPWEKLEVPQEAEQTIDADSIDIAKFLPSQLDYYHYEGSLTTPPCSEIVMWYLVKQPLKIPEEFLEKLRGIKDESGKSLVHNHRQCMPLHDRSVMTPYSEAVDRSPSS